MKNIAIYLILASTFIANSNSLAAMPSKDTKDSKDHPLVSRYPDSVITRYSVTDFDEYQFPTGPLANKKLPSQTVEGKYTTIVYRLPKQLSTLQILRNYEQAFKKSGLKTKFSCNQLTCGHLMPKEFLMAQGGGHAKKARYLGVDVYNTTKQRSDYRFWAGTLERKGVVTYITFMVYKNSAAIHAFLDVVESKEMELGLVTLNLDALSDALKSEGKVVLNGIFFDHDKDTLKLESKDSMQVIAKYLKANAGVKTFVVGHTDSKGNFKHNMDLSKRRASAVANELIKKYEIQANRLTPVGIGPVSPAVSNDSDDGRKQNRRVELVLNE